RIREDDHLRALAREIGRQIPAASVLAEWDADQLGALQRRQRVVEAVGRPRAGDLFAWFEERPVQDGQTVVGAVAGEDLFGADAEAGRGGHAQARAHRVRV